MNIKISYYGLVYLLIGLFFGTSPYSYSQGEYGTHRFDYDCYQSTFLKKGRRSFSGGRIQFGVIVAESGTERIKKKNKRILDINLVNEEPSKKVFVWIEVGNPYLEKSSHRLIINTRKIKLPKEGFFIFSREHFKKIWSKESKDMYSICLQFLPQKFNSLTGNGSIEIPLYSFHEKRKDSIYSVKPIRVNYNIIKGALYRQKEEALASNNNNKGKTQVDLEELPENGRSNEIAAVDSTPQNNAGRNNALTGNAGNTNENTRSSSSNSNEKGEMKKTDAFAQAKENGEEGLCEYIANQGEKVKEAKQLLSQLFQLELRQRSKSEFTILIKGNCQLKPSISFDNPELVKTYKFHTGLEQDSFSLDLQQDSRVSVGVANPWNEEGIRKFTLDAGIDKITVNISSTPDSIYLKNISGGLSDGGYYLRVWPYPRSKDPKPLKDIHLPATTEYAFAFDAYDVFERGKSYEVALGDSRRTVFEGHDTVSLPANVLGIVLSIAIPSLILIGGLFFFFYRNHLLQEQRALIANDQSYLARQNGNGHHYGPSAVPKIVIRDQKQPTEEDIPKEELPTQLGEATFFQRVDGNKNDFYPFDIQLLWKDTQVERVYVKDRSFALKLHRFLEEANELYAMRNEGHKIPEVGGFILGQKVQNPQTGGYYLALQRFVEFIPKEENVYKLEFNESAFNRLNEELELYPKYKLLGWFHSHPGHGLFLSQEDLRIHENFFKEPYQIAMEIDTVQEEKSNPGLHLGFFTRKKKGEINNGQPDGENWFQWGDVCSWLTQTHS